MRPELCKKCQETGPLVGCGGIDCYDLCRAYDAGRAEGERAKVESSDAWKAAMQEAVRLVRFANVDEHGGIGDLGVERVCESLAGSPAPKSYEDGIRDAALKIRDLYNAHIKFESHGQCIGALGEAYDALCTMLGYNPADALASGAKADE